MKAFYLTFMFCLCFSLVSAQSYSKLLDNKGWYVMQEVPQLAYTKPLYWIINDRDTVINSVNYACLVFKGPYSSGNNPYLVLREDTIAKKVYIWRDSVEVVLFSFTATNAGQADTFYGQSQTIDSIGSINTPSGLHRVFYYYGSSNCGNVEYAIAEGIGQISCNGAFNEENDTRDVFVCSYDRYGQTIYNRWANYCSSYVSINNIQSRSFEIYPNPATSKIFIKSDSYISNANLLITDILGQTIYRLEEMNGTLFEIDLSRKPKGIVFVRLDDKHGNVCLKKILIE